MNMIRDMTNVLFLRFAFVPIYLPFVLRSESGESVLFVYSNKQMEERDAFLHFTIDKKSYSLS